MAEEEKNEETEEQPEAQDAGSDPSPDEAPEPVEAEGSDPSESGGDTPAEPEAAEEPAAEAEEPAEEPAEPAPAAEAPAEDAEPLDMHPKAVRRRTRSQAPTEARPQRSAEERAAERAERRRQAAISRRRYRQSQRSKRGEPATGTPPADGELANPKVRQGMVLSSKGDKTITVKVELVGRHRRYEKVVRRSRTLHAHDESNQANEGDVVRIVETRPLSKTKRWRLAEILERAR
jgi:small subunit ribosomal protein S17